MISALSDLMETMQRLTEPETDFYKKMIHRVGIRVDEELPCQIERADRDLRCCWRALGRVSLLALFSAAGASGAWALLPSVSPHAAEVSLKFFAILGVASLLSMAAFLLAGLWHRCQLHQLFDESRLIILKSMVCPDRSPILTEAEQLPVPQLAIATRGIPKRSYSTYSELLGFRKAS